ncbi:signal peptidase complex subunit 2 [Geopyxis carbonaria]|nr:signal peptidase complex subunit 2 [Geopyxis carbonaria]
MAAKVNLHAISELKNTSDDAIAPYMKKQGFTQSNLLTDVRLGLGLTACAIAGTTFYYDYTLGFEKTKEATLYAVVAYFVLNTLLTGWMWLVEGNTVYVGQRGDIKVTIASHNKKYTPVYELKITTTEVGKKPEVTEVKNLFAGWFDQQGYFVVKPFQAFLQNSIPVIAKNTLEAEMAIQTGKR